MRRLIPFTRISKPYPRHDMKCSRVTKILTLPILIASCFIADYFYFSTIPKLISTFNYAGLRYEIYNWRDSGFDYIVQMRAVRANSTLFTISQILEYEHGKCWNVVWQIDPKNKNIIRCKIDSLLVDYDISNHTFITNDLTSPPKIGPGAE